MDPDAIPPAPPPVPPAAADVRFPALYGAEPDAVWAAPGRVNLIGEHTDYNGGLALPFAIDRAARAAVRAVPGARTVRVATSWSGATAEHPSSPHPPPPGEPSPGILELPLDQLADIEPDRVPPWARFPVGVARELLRRGVPVPPFELLLDSDVPVGAGLSSSAAIGCSVALALDELAHAGSSRRDLADVCRAAENDFVGAPTGIMDQSASLLATEDHALLLDCRTGESRAVPLPLQAAGLVLLVVDTTVSHEHGTGGYADRVDSCQQAARALGVASLREVAADQLPRAAALLDAETFRRLRHVVTENDRVRAVARALDHLATAPAEASKRWTEVGRLLTAGHASLRDDYAVSCAELDLAVDSALAAGALGARMTGGGFGGSAIVLAREDDAGAVTTAVRRAFAQAGFESPAVFPVRPGPGAHRL